MCGFVWLYLEYLTKKSIFDAEKTVYARDEDRRCSHQHPAQPTSLSPQPAPHHITEAETSLPPSPPGVPRGRTRPLRKKKGRFTRLGGRTHYDQLPSGKNATTQRRSRYGGRKEAKHEPMHTCVHPSIPDPVTPLFCGPGPAQPFPSCREDHIIQS